MTSIFRLQSKILRYIKEYYLLFSILLLHL